MSRNQGSGGTGAVFEWPSSRANCAIRARDVISVEGGQPAREKGVRRGGDREYIGGQAGGSLVLQLVGHASPCRYLGICSELAVQLKYRYKGRLARKGGSARQSRVALVHERNAPH